MTGKNRIFNSSLLTLSILLFSGCTTGFTSIEYDYSIQDIQKVVVENMPNSLGATSENRREFYSKPFNIDQEKKAKLSVVMRITVLGDRRPYSLDVQVRQVSSRLTNIQEAFEQGADYQGQESLAKRIVTKIDNELAQRRKDKNLFDDFRPF